MIIKIIQNLENRMGKRQETFNNCLEELQNKQTKMIHTITEIEKKNHYKQCRLNDAN